MKFVAIPLFTHNRRFGVIHIESLQDSAPELTAIELRFFQALSTFMGMALENANIFLQTKSELTSSKHMTELEVAEKKCIQEVFSRYTSPDLVRKLMKNPRSISLGGVNREATILFTDISGFTRFSSGLSPEEIVGLMNRYFSRMTEVVMANKGEIDKFIGDAMMVRFGVLGPLENPGLAAVKTALGMIEELELLMQEWRNEGREGFSIRIGIAGGPVLAGNIGSEQRMEYTVMGSTVNLASRLEALNKELGTTILINSRVQEQIKGFIGSKPMGERSIRGFPEPESVFEVLRAQETA